MCVPRPHPAEKVTPGDRNLQNKFWILEHEEARGDGHMAWSQEGQIFNYYNHFL